MIRKGAAVRFFTLSSSSAHSAMVNPISPGFIARYGSKLLEKLVEPVYNAFVTGTAKEVLEAVESHEDDEMNQLIVEDWLIRLRVRHLGKGKAKAGDLLLKAELEEGFVQTMQAQTNMTVCSLLANEQGTGSACRQISRLCVH